LNGAGTFSDQLVLSGQFGGAGMPPFRRDPDAGRRAISMLAVIIVLAGGLSTCLAIVLGSSREPVRPALATVLGFVLVGWFLFQLQVKRERTLLENVKLWLSSTDRSRPTETYRLKRIVPASKKLPLGSNQPPTVEQIREIKQINARWVQRGGSQPPSQ
jgi:hypothetical protein